MEEYLPLIIQLVTDAVASGGMDMSSILGSVAGGGVGGGIIMSIIGVIKNMMSK